ncbi:histone-like nucleoid-structuring protein, MvaT/MvaU family [Pseudomonas sp. NPDC047961]|jgi:hypothetical protein|tara:strand:- start:340 stop:708 length:369 start_codon:yes stop_codon:yes gene_type:complete
MSKIAEFRALEAQIGEHLRRLEALKGDDALQKEIAFEQKLNGLLQKYDMTLRDVINILEPGSTKTSQQATAPTGKAVRRERTLKRYKNPNTGEVVETKGGNHKTLKAWKKEFGNDTVESWLQ